MQALAAHKNGQNLHVSYKMNMININTIPRERILETKSVLGKNVPAAAFYVLNKDGREINGNS